MYYIDKGEYLNYLKRLLILCSFKEPKDKIIREAVDELWTEILRCNGIKYEKEKN
jgi:hypothetical protein